MSHHQNVQQKLQHKDCLVGLDRFKIGWNRQQQAKITFIKKLTADEMTRNSGILLP
jgi:hypothetical protein